ncbi:hypothetical protein [Sphingomonas sp.]|uniref:hypothetical protein n=1 Tax=Sphingomonas sp. TaxID=28214 RepID=UPI0025F22E93|nr:hypothetical protein [Sphingomonas sp.]MBV9528323.1 hypothetical protein [Sphingomonas sp.]
MAVEADKVVTELVAQTDKFNADIKVAANTYQASMGQMENAAGGAEKATGKLSLAANNNRVAMLELQHVVRGSTDQFAAGAPLTQIFAQHVASVGEAAALAGGSMGKFGAFLAGPWGLAATAAVGIITTLIAKYHAESDSVEDLIGKLREHFEKTQNSEEADRQWAQTIDGLIEKQEKLNEVLAKRVGPSAQGQSFIDIDTTEKSLKKFQEDLDKITKVQLPQANKALATAKALPTLGGDPQENAALAIARNNAISEAQGKIDQLNRRVDQLNKQIAAAQQAVTNGQLALANSAADASADATAAIESQKTALLDLLNAAVQAKKINVDVAQQARTAIDQYAEALSKAATAGVTFDANRFDQQVASMANKLAKGKGDVDAFTKALDAQTRALERDTKAAQDRKKVDPVSQFKRDVIGAEGTGANAAGSSAYGLGQFMPGTWLSYFKRTYPSQASGMNNPDILALRDKPRVASAIIDAATDDYIKVLKAAGQSITEANLYTVHVLGEPAAKKFFAASDSASARSVVGSNVASVNGNIFTGTVAQAKAELAKRIEDSSPAISQGAAELAQLQQQEVEQARQYADKMSGLDDQVLEARKTLGLSAQETADIETAAVKLSHDRYEANAKELEKEGKLGGNLGELLAKNDAVEQARLKVVQSRLSLAQAAERREAADKAAATAEAQINAEQDLLRSSEQLVTSTRERRAIEDRLIALQFEEERTALERQIARADELQAIAATSKNAEAIKAASDAEAAAAIARAKLKNLPQQEANTLAANAQQNASPLQAFFGDVRKQAGDVNDALETIAANGLQNVVDGLSQAAAGFQSLGDVGRSVLQTLTAALVKLALQEIIAHTIGRAASAASGAASIAQATAVGAAISAAMAGPAALMSLATSGANSIGAQAGIASTIGLATILGAPKALGGRIFGPGGDTADNILTPSSRDEYMIRASSARAIGYDVLDHMNQTGALPSFGGPVNGRASAPGGAYGGISPRDIERLEAAIHASRSDVSVYAGLDPSEIMQRAFGAPAGKRAFLAHLSANSAAINASLGRKG